jgi:septum formation protein
LLAQIGVTPSEVRPADVDETPRKNETPLAYCRRVTKEKVLAVSSAADELVLCGDTAVAVGRRILGKPESRSEAETFLRLLSGRRHRVITAIAVKYQNRIWERDVTSAVRMKHLSGSDIQGYLDTNDWQGKAGGYAIQGPASAFIPWISGSYSAIVGLPLAETQAILKVAGYRDFGERS